MSHSPLHQPKGVVLRPGLDSHAQGMTAGFQGLSCEPKRPDLKKKKLAVLSQKLSLASGIRDRSPWKEITLEKEVDKLSEKMS